MDSPITFKCLNTVWIVLVYLIIVSLLATLWFQMKRTVFPLFKSRKILGLGLLFRILSGTAFLTWVNCFFIYLMSQYFVGLEIRKGTLTLDYCWPWRDVVLTDSNPIGLKVEKYRKRGKRVVLVITENGRSFTSESMFIEETEKIVKAISSKLKVQNE